MGQCGRLHVDFLGTVSWNAFWIQYLFQFLVTRVKDLMNRIGRRSKRESSNEGNRAFLNLKFDE